MVKSNGICARYCVWAFAETTTIKFKTTNPINKEICNAVVFIKICLLIFIERNVLFY